MSTRTFNGEHPSSTHGRQLFEIGCTIKNATRFADFPTNDAEISAYFNWERESLILFAHSVDCPPEDACRAITSQHDYKRCNGVVAYQNYSRRYKCVVCGSVASEREV